MDPKSTAGESSERTPSMGTGATAGESSERTPSMETGAFSCFHMEDPMRPLIHYSDLHAFSLIDKFIEGFYSEAQRRLPLDEIPELVDCICTGGGHCIGLADPVTNIILNSIGLLVHNEESLPLHPKWPPRPSWVCRRPGSTAAAAASRSYNGLRAFMTTYFRYLSDVQARRYLHLASYDLSLAIELVHHDRTLDQQQPRRRILPDGGRTKGALRVAALLAQHPAPDVLARLMTAGYPSSDFSHLMDKLRGTTEVLSTYDVSEIRRLLTLQWPPSRPQVNVEFWCRPDPAGGRERPCFTAGGSFRLQTCIGERHHLAHIIIFYDEDHGNHQEAFLHISDLEQRASEREKLAKCLDRVRVPRPRTIDFDASPPCEHTMSLKLCLRDTIHAFYIKALAIIPQGISISHFLRSLLMAGHCYGYFDPVTNIILNTLWYSVAFPFSYPGGEDQLPVGILDTRIMARLGSRSLNGLVTIARSAMISDHQALELLNSCDCNITSCSDRIIIREDTFLHAAKAAKHPQYAAFGSFFGRFENARYLLFLLGKRDGGRISYACWLEACTELSRFCTGCTLYSEVPAKKLNLSILASFAVSKNQSASKDKLIFVRAKLDELLYKYCHQHPWEPDFKLEIICGVMEFSPRYDTKHYHVNFLASIGDAEQTLFFAEFTASPLSKVESKSSRCSPVDSSECTGRCSICEKELSKILHPPSGGYFGDIDGSTTDLYRPDVHKLHEEDFERLLSEDYIYFEPDRDAEFAKIINDLHSYEHSVLPAMPVT